MRFASLGSGSEGNAFVIETVERVGGATRVMLDCGFGLREIERRLLRHGLEPSSLNGILVTHEHGDHIGGVFKLARRYQIPVYLTHGTYRTVSHVVPKGTHLNLCDSHESFRIQGLEIHPYPVPHDAAEPIQFAFTNGDKRVGVVTDLGHATPHVIAMLSGCHALVLECNHDTERLQASNYPPSLKARIAGSYGHLSNQAAADLLARVCRKQLQTLHAAHLSQQNNTPLLVQEVLAAVLNCAPNEIGIANQEEGFAWVGL